jgi:hypothetical protein
MTTTSPNITKLKKKNLGHSYKKFDQDPLRPNFLAHLSTLVLINLCNNTEKTKGTQGKACFQVAHIT